MESWNDKQKSTLLRKLKHERLCKHISKASKFEFDDPNDKNFWRTSIDEMELKSKKSAQCNRIKKVDLSASLPADLKVRVGEITPISHLDDDSDGEDQEFIDDYNEAVRKSLAELSIDQALLDKITEAQMDYDKDVFDVKIDEKPTDRKPSVYPANWMANYFKKDNRERIIWQTKLYMSKQRFEDKSLFEQVEELTDLSAISFVKWLNELGQEKSDVTEDMIKKLFSIGIEDGVSRASKFSSNYYDAVSDSVADYWALEKKGVRHSIKVATENERKFRGFKNYEQPDVIPQIFKDIRTFEGIFKGIHNLTSVQLLVEHLKKNPQFEKPKYLLDMGLFASKKDIGKKETKKQKTLYDYD